LKRERKDGKNKTRVEFYFGGCTLKEAKKPLPVSVRNKWKREIYQRIKSFKLK
jgi:hypothetical protein